MACIACGQMFHEECENGGCETCHGDQDQLVNNFRQGLAGGGSKVKPDHLVTDVLSTGRKRAANLYPIDKNAACEWRGLKNVGGGIPIIGCINGFQQDRHHGPDKTTTNNSKGNVHRICKKCHKRWHYANDESYKFELWSKTVHDPVAATEDELKKYELRWVRTPRGHVNVERED